MNKPKFTPKPWYISTYETRQRMTILDRQLEHYDPRHTIATVCRAKGHETANAALMVKAPDMYEDEESNVDMLARCENLLRGISEMPYLPDGFQDHAFYREWADEIREYIKKTNSLLAKARGEEVE